MLKISLIFYLFCLLVKFSINDSNDSNDLCSSTDFKHCGTCFIQEETIQLEKCGLVSCKFLTQPNEVGGHENSLNFNFHDKEEKLEKRAKNKSIRFMILKNLHLNNIPEFVCRLKNVTEIFLENNCLETLPNGCFSKLKSLQKLTIIQNNIKLLQNGLFDGLQNLNHLILNNNNIEIIENNVFSNKTDLLSLKVIDLNHNNLKTVDGWILIRALAVNESVIDLSSNEIESLTNKINYTFTCADKPKSSPAFRLDLHNNQLKHITDFMQYFPGDINLGCLFGTKLHSEVTIELTKNKQECDCRIFKMVKIFQSFNYIGMFDGINCDSPVNLQNKRLLSLKPNELECTKDINCPESCFCSEKPYWKTYFIDCKNKNKISLPSSINMNTSVYPPSSYLLNLSFSENLIESVRFRSYFNVTRALDLSNNLIENIELTDYSNFPKLEELYLHSNKIKTVPKDFLLNSSKKFKILTLHNNSWDCSCNNQYLKNWMLNLKSRSIQLLNPSSILCETPKILHGRNIFSVADEEFCINPYERERNFILMVVLIPIISVSLIIIIVLLIVRKFKVEINVYLNVHPFDRDECQGENMEYDAFVSCSYSDREYGINLVRLLESKGYRVCYHEKDFIGGQSIAVNIVEAVKYSKRVICFMTTHFINSTYCMFEFQTALHRNIEMNRKRLIVVLDERLKIDKDCLPNDVYNFLKTHTYVELTEGKKWINQLFYSMPIKSIEGGSMQEKGGLSEEIVLAVQ